jgi:N-acetylneuraminic acid mutarotase
VHRFESPTAGSPSSVPARPPRRRTFTAHLRTGRVLTAVVAVLVLVAMSLVGSTAQAAGPGNGSAGTTIHGNLATGRLSVVDLCSATVAKNVARCYAKRVVSAPKHGVRPNADAPVGYSPADLISAYNLPSDGGAGATIGIVDAYDNPNALADLTVYRAQYGLPALTEGQFRKVNQRGVEGSYPEPDADWAGEIALDIDMVSAIAPNANILLVEADSANFDDLGAAVNQAVALGATYVSNSYGTSYTSTPGSGEDASEVQLSDAYYDHPGVAVVASSGDDAYGVSFPAASAAVTAVGGTSLVRDAAAGRGWNESVWNNQYGGPGSGCSLYVEKPAFQTDTGCAMRSVADVSAVSDPATGVSVYNTYGPDGTGWAQYGGTSAASPIIAAVYALGGPIPAGTSPNSFPYAKRTALNDVSTGANGTCTPAYLCTGTAGYDGPTGLGTPKGAAAFRSGPHGFATGTVTDATTDAPVTGAVVTAGDASATTDETGAYSLSLEPGTYTLTTSAYGYATKKVGSVIVTDGGTVTRNIALQAVPRVRLSGNVTDGSGHAWPVYARISIDGVPGGAIYTDPYTGQYSVSLPRQRDYTMHVDANYPGYLSLARTVHVRAKNLTRNLSIKADPLQGSAPGYGNKVSGATTTFDDTSAPPAGWTVTNATDGGGWEFDDPGTRTNLTGGTGGFAIVDSDEFGTGKNQDSVLAAPAIDFTGTPNPVVDFRTDYKSFGNQYGDVDYSIDGGTTWINAWHQTASVNGQVRVPLPQAAGKAGVLVRFHFVGSFGYWWQLDDIRIGGVALTVVNGGLVAGTVTDANTGDGVVAATVTNTAKPTENAATTATPDDPNLGDGFYWFFATGSGSRVLTAHKGGYTDVSHAVNLRPNLVAKADISLDAGQITVAPAGISKTVAWKGHASTNLTVTNTGNAAATVKLGEQPGGSVIAAKAGAKPHRVRASVSLHRMATGTSTGKATGGAVKARPDVSPSDAPWESVADLPVATQDNAADVDNGVLYSAFGYTSPNDTADLYAYDTTAAAWSKKASAADTREAPAHGFIGGKWYISGGWGSTGNPDAKTEVYDPATDSWASAANNPVPLAGSASAVIGGKLFVVGGCTASACGSTTVQSYDPAADAWSSAADYPEPISWESCGNIAGTLYCAGGASDDGTVAHGYSYDPAADEWNPIADLPTDLWGSAYTAANGRLLIVGGVTDQSSTVTNEGYGYDPISDEWSSLPNANTATFRGGSALGFYKVGGSPGTGGGVLPVATVEILPGFDQGGTTDVSWLSESATTFTLAPGQSKKVKVTLDAAVPEITQPGTFTASIVVGTDTPYQVPPVPVSFTVNPPTSWGKVLGVVSAKAADGTITPLAGATVEIDSPTSQYTLKTGADGSYALWLSSTNHPLTLIVAKDGYRPQTRVVPIAAGKRTTANFTLVKP